jgi:predicted regulator of Ras-like GTPase activity (Roadblock/LC7/MglB family)
MAYSKDTKLGQTIEKIISEIPGLIAMAVIDINSGMSLASHSVNPSFDPEIASAYNAEVVKQKMKAISALRLTGETIDDILITLTSHIHILKVLTNANYFIYVAANSREVNLAIVRSVLKKYAAEISL